MHELGLIGIDLGGTKTLLALFDEKFRLIEQVKFKTLPQKGEKRFTRMLTEAAEQLTKTAREKGLSLVGVGIGCAGLVDDSAPVLKESPNIPFLKDYPFGARLKKITGANVVIGNDVHVGLYGEHQFGAAMGCANVIGVFLGTGVGAALMIDGKLYKGASGAAGEIGRFLLQPMGPLAGSERHGILDQVASRTAIAGEASSMAAKQWAPYLFKKVGTNVAKIQSRVLAQSIKGGDKAIEDLVRSRARIVGFVLSNLVNFLSPEMVVIGGGMVEAMPKIILKEVETGMREFLVPAVAKTVKVAVAKLEDHAVTTGAAKLALDSFVAAQQARLSP
jgi:glucokinase